MEFRGFTTDEAIYSRLLADWRGRWGRVSDAVSAGKLWQPDWLYTGDADGNPLFSAWSRLERRGIRIIHYEPEPDQTEFESWQDVVGEGEDAVHELVIACAPTAPNLRRAEREIIRWIAGDETAALVVTRADGDLAMEPAYAEAA